MRIWSLHPSYLDTKGLVALWRETLLAKKVLENKTKGYKNHPQLIRFKGHSNPIEAINYYLSQVYFQALYRGYKFNDKKINWEFTEQKLNVSSGQIKYEWEHLIKKLKIRDIIWLDKIKDTENILPHPIFQVVDGKIENWEVIN